MNTAIAMREYAGSKDSSISLPDFAWGGRLERGPYKLLPRFQLLCRVYLVNRNVRLALQVCGEEANNVDFTNSLIKVHEKVSGTTFLKSIRHQRGV